MWKKMLNNGYYFDGLAFLTFYERIINNKYFLLKIQMIKSVYIHIIFTVVNKLAWRFIHW